MMVSACMDLTVGYNVLLARLRYTAAAPCQAA